LDKVSTVLTTPTTSSIFPVLFCKLRKAPPPPVANDAVGNQWVSDPIDLLDSIDLPLTY